MRLSRLSLRRLPAALCAALLALAGPALALTAGAGEPSGFDPDAALARSQAVVGARLGDHVLRDRQGRAVSLSALRGRPLVISLIYTSCYRICPVTTRHLARAVHRAREALGQDSFTVITVGFDAAVDDPAAMAAYARKQGVAGERRWRFLSGEARAIQALADDLGFSYARSPKGFDHLLQTTIVDADGRIHRQVYGELLHAPPLVEPLKSLVLGGAEPGFLADLVKRVRLYCTVYDPAADRYRFDYSLFIEIGIGLLALAGIAAYLTLEVRRGRRARRA